MFSVVARENLFVPIMESSPPGTNDEPEFLLDGYDWMTIESDIHDELGIPPGEDQAARWYPITDESREAKKQGNQGKLDVSSVVDDSITGTIETSDSTRNEGAGPLIRTHHFPLHPVSDPIRDGDMGIAKYLGVNARARVSARILFFDRYGWPEQLDEKKSKN